MTDDEVIPRILDGSSLRTLIEPDPAFTVGAYLVINRDQSAVATSLYPAIRCLNLAAPVWAAA